MEMRKKRWGILAANCLVNLCIGSLYTWSVFAAPLAEHLNLLNGLSGSAALTASNLAIVFTVANAVSPILLILGGMVNDKVGPKRMILLAGLLFGGGMILSGFATSTAMLIVTYGLMVGPGASLAYGCTVSGSVKFFPDKRGLVGGIAVAVYGLSSVIIPPIANALINTQGVSAAFIILGCVFAVVICISSFFTQKCPPGYIPEGWTAPLNKDGTSPIGVDKTWRQMLRDPIFYIMLLLFASGSFCGLMMISQASPVAQQMVGMSAATAATVVSTLALFNAAGRIFCGFLSDRVGRINTLTGALIVSILAVLLLYNTGTGQVGRFYTGICIIGFCFGGFLSVFPGFTTDKFGSRHNSVNYGLMFIGFSLASILGPGVLSAIYQRSGHYQAAFLVACGFAVAGLALTVAYRWASKKHSRA